MEWCGVLERGECVSESECVGICLCPLSPLLSPRSLQNNNIGADGARAVGDALKTNTTLTEL